MIFAPDLAEKILRGEKTVTRRPRKPDDSCRYQVGRTYAVQPGRGKSAIGRIRVMSVEAQELRGVFAPGEVQREGFAGSVRFLDRWFSMYPNAQSGYDPVWRIEFELVEEPEAERAASPAPSNAESKPLYPIKEKESCDSE